MKNTNSILFSFIYLFLACENTSPLKPENAPPNGNLDTTFANNPSTVELTPEQVINEKKEILISEGWESQYVENGQLPECYNFLPMYSNIDNYLRVYVGSGTDVAIKIMNIENDQCVRYIFINSGSTYNISNIPEGNYYLKIAYGKDWLSKIENDQCIGKFLRDPIYEKGTDILDFFIKYTADGYSIPSYSLELDVISSQTSNSFNSHNISEEDFNQ